MILHILVAIIVGLETYPGSLSKPGAVIGIPVSLVVWNLAFSLLLYYLTLYSVWYHAWTRTCLLSLGA